MISPLLNALQWTLVTLGALMALGTFASLSRSPHWAVRSWDFPRLQIAVVAVVAGVGFGICFRDGRAWEWVWFAAVAAAVVWQLYKIWPYTRLARTTVKVSEAADGPTISLLVSNVLMENERYDALLDLVRETKPDVVLALEVDQRWETALSPLSHDYLHIIRQPQDNFYGLILYSRLELIDPCIEFLVQDDVPSVRADVVLSDGTRILLRGLHPRPPEPLRDQKSTPRDAELVMVGRAIGEARDRPTVVAGDLNDVAWSRTTELFLELSGLLDPRVGRGMFSSFNAKSRIFRYPLDHIFHSNHFRLVDFRRLPSIGSDHFPVFVELRYEPESRGEQPETAQDEDTQEEAGDVIQKQAEAAATGDDRPSRE